MLNFTQIFLVFLSAFVVIAGDSLIKKISTESIMHSLKNPLMFLVYLLYFAQIVFAVYIFIYKGELAIYANYYVVFYAILGVVFGLVFFRENLNLIQFLGILLALVGVVLMNSASKTL